MSWIRKTDQGCLLTLKIIPRSSRNVVVGQLGEALKIKLQAPPLDGKANQALIRFLSKKIGCNRSSIVINKGESNRNKLVSISGLPPETIREKLENT